MNNMTTKHVIRFVITLLTVFLILSSITSASKFETGDRFVVTKEQVINDDIYFAGNAIVVEGVVNGDVIAAGNDIRVNGIVNGSLMAAGNSITVDGSIIDDMRTAGGFIIINGNVGDNVLAFGGEIVLAKDARIKRDLTLGGDSVTIDGIVGGNINGDVSNMKMNGISNGNVTVNVENDLKVLENAKIGGNLEYTAQKPAEISGIVSGETSYKEKPKEENGFISDITGEIVTYLWLILVGIILLIITPGMTQKISDAIFITPLKNLLWGIIFLTMVPIVALIFIITIIGIPISLILIAIYIFVIYISRIFVGFWIGQYILKFKNKVFSLAIGLLIIFIGINLPIIGTFIHFMVIVIGLGAIILTVYDIYRKTKQENSFL